VDPADLDPGWERLAPEQSSGSGVATHLLVTAVRETFEECGVLLARDQSGQPCLPELVASLGPLRQRTQAGQPDGFLAGLSHHRLRPAWEDLHFCAHWVTPEGMPRIFDTRFFLALLPTGQLPSRDEGEELESLRWVAPDAALAEAVRGEALLLPPTRAVLENLAAHKSAADALRAAATATVQRVQPKLEEVTGTRYPGLDMTVLQPTSEDQD
jgi:8-oxo-dGTP pyrophosphatase MutT (NUDIX family)